MCLRRVFILFAFVLLLSCGVVSRAAAYSGYVPALALHSLDIAPIEDEEPSGGAADGAVDGAAGVPDAPPDGGATDAGAVDAPRRPTREDIGRMSREDLFRHAFGRAAVDRPRELTLVLFSEGRELGNTDIVYNDDFTEFDFISPVFSALLDTVLLPEYRPGAGDSIGYFRSSVLRAAGYAVTADEQAYVLRVQVPPDGKALQRTNLKGRYDRGPKAEKIRPANVSMYMNYTLNNSMYYVNHTYTHPASGLENRIEDYSRTTASLNLDGALNVFGRVLEGTVLLTEPDGGQPFTWDNYRRGDVRFVRELVSRNSRFTAGDVSLELGIATVGGMRYEYNEGFYSRDMQDGESVVLFFMPRAGLIEVHMDGIFRERFYLLAGMHEIRGFGGNMGRNRVRLVLRMENGAVEEVPFEYLLGDPRGLRRNESRYAAAAGVRRETAPSPACFEYQIKEPAVSVNYMYGLTRHVSLGVSAVGSEYNSVAEGQAMIDMGPVGWFDLRGSANYTPGAEIPHGERIDLRYYPNTNLMIQMINRRITKAMDLDGVYSKPLPYMSVSMSGYWQSAAYNPNPFRNPPQSNAVLGGVSGNMGFGFLYGSIMATGGATLYRDTSASGENYHPLAYNYGARLSQRVFNIPISVSGGVYVRGGEHSPYFSINMSRMLGLSRGYGRTLGRHQFSASANVGANLAYTPVYLSRIDDPEDDGPLYEFVTDRDPSASIGGGGRVDWRWSNGTQGNGAQSYWAGVNVPDILDPKFTGMRASMRQTHNRAQLTASYSLVNQTTQTTLRGQTHYLSGMLDGSVMFADGLWAFGRPVYDGFILAEAKHNFAGANVHVNRSHLLKRDYSRNGLLGAAYHNAIASYTSSPITLTITDAPPGVLLENNRFYAFGGYKQGYALRIGRKEGVMMQVRLMDNGKPLSYTYATVERDDGRPEPEKRATFTGGDGLLQMNNLAPGGVYVIGFGSGSSIKEIEIEVPRDSDAILELPDITVVRE